MGKRTCRTCGDRIKKNDVFCDKCLEVINSIIDVMVRDDLFKYMKQKKHGDWIIHVDILNKTDNVPLRKNNDSLYM